MHPGDSNSRPVFSSDDGALCPECGKVVSSCVCPPAEEEIPKGDRIRLSFDAKGRKGKPVTVVTGLPLGEKDLKALAKELKKKCGSGGSVKDGAIEIQGDQRDRLEEELAKRGYATKRSGGR